MKKRSLVIVLFFITSVSIAQSKQQSLVAKSAEALRIAMVDANVTELLKLTGDSLSYGHSSGLIENREQFIEKLRTGKSDFVNIDITGQRIQVIDKTALVRHLLSGNINDNGVAATVKLYVLQVWQRKGNKWKLIARQATKAL
ncbi:MAG TPA: nuclear transport factor 2 family protein [Ferruginibacter sp.]|nr:nuclear transport factor 2 family protein [Ferruginibacter sp.]